MQYTTIKQFTQICVVKKHETALIITTKAAQIQT